MRLNKNQWIDVRDYFRTDDNFRDAVIDWAFTEERVNSQIIKLFNGYDIVLTQGFIGSTDEMKAQHLEEKAAITPLPFLLIY